MSRTRSTNDALWETVECRQSDPDLWFSDTLEGKGVQFTEEIFNGLKIALETCNRCPLRVECLQMGLTEEDKRWGIWGGYMAGERQAMLGENRTRDHQIAMERARYIRKNTGVPRP